MNQYVVKLIKEYVKNYAKKNNLLTRWKEPLVAYADANDKRFLNLNKIASPTHALPQDFLNDAKTVIAYFLPFDESISKSNIKGKISSKEWVLAYIDTNQLIFDLNNYIKNELNKLNYDSTIIPATHDFKPEVLMSDWSHRHVAHIAGLGKFGINNMLITKKGCCGRIGSIVTNLKIEPTKIDENEYCLYKANGTCKICINRCVCNALEIDSYNRFECYEVLLNNAKHFTDIGLADVCGKCLVGLPCSFKNPVNH